MNIQSSLVGASFKSLNLSPHDVRVRARSDSHTGLADVVIQAGGEESVYAQFSDARALNLGPNPTKTTPAFGADLRFVGLPAGSILFLGVRLVVMLNPETGKTRLVLKRFRDDAEDHGFYRDELIELADGVALVYEGGAARILSAGETRWHTALTWNDVLVRSDQEALHFVGEEPDGLRREWTVDLRSGSKIGAR